MLRTRRDRQLPEAPQSLSVAFRFSCPPSPSTMPRSWSRWIAGGALAAGLVVLYFFAWRPGRAALTEHVAHPVLASVGTDRARTFQHAFRRGALRIGLRSSRPDVGGADYHAPAGRDFLLPALLLAFLFPYRPYWVYLWGFHLAVGAFFLGLLVLGVGWTDLAFALHGFLDRYVVQALSLGAPLLALGYERGLFSASDVTAT